ncbi:hypothetical protein SDC9_179992 [bioreactor metagenome]|uniref:Uncharacterized protein n=1 Tax=bioreactor metagenome TaxID=1076179 RepID=A0A645H9P5_9ZZZZ
MASERQIHAKVFGLEHISAGSAANEPAVVSTADEGPQLMSETPETGKHQQSPNGSRAPTPVGASDLGDNVELF